MVCAIRSLSLELQCLLFGPEQTAEILGKKWYKRKHAHPCSSCFHSWILRQAWSLQGYTLIKIHWRAHQKGGRYF